ncbi:MAG: hypothetical protein KDD44_02765 [Bdellovibrionales bacterium]|nr:hypothetical protein [Bdellovibrionales bacterium]
MHWYIGNLGLVDHAVETIEGVPLPPLLKAHRYWSVHPTLSHGSVLDLRSMPSMEATTEVGVQMAIVSTPNDVPVPAGYVKIGAGPLREIQVNASARSAVTSATKQRTTSPHLLGVLRELFVSGADRDGNAGPKPIVPSYGRLMGLVGLKFQPNRPDFSVVLDRIREDYRIVRANSPKYRMWLASMLSQHRIDHRYYRLFQPADLPDETPEHPNTPITETFPGTSATLGGDLTWTEYDAGFQNVSDAAFKSGTAFGTARADSDLPAGDMYAQTRISMGTNAYGWLDNAVRFSSSVQTCYYSYTRSADSASITAAIYKRVSGSDTLLASHLGSTYRYTSTDYNSRLNVIGSDLELLADDETTSRLTATDTAITSSNVRAGVSGRDNGANTYGLEWMAEEIAVAGASFPIGTLLLLGVGQ